MRSSEAGFQARSSVSATGWARNRGTPGGRGVQGQPGLCHRLGLAFQLATRQPDRGSYGGCTVEVCTGYGGRVQGVRWVYGGRVHGARWSYGGCVLGARWKYGGSVHEVRWKCARCTVVVRALLRCCCVVVCATRSRFPLTMFITRVLMSETRSNPTARQSLLRAMSDSHDNSRSYQHELNIGCAFRCRGRGVRVGCRRELSTIGHPRLLLLALEPSINPLSAAMFRTW